MHILSVFQYAASNGRDSFAVILYNREYILLCASFFPRLRPRIFSKGIFVLSVVPTLNYIEEDD